MRVMLKVRMESESANAAIKSGALPRLIQSTIEELKPEAAYFLAEEGKRTGLFFFDLKDVSQIPVIAEPWFMAVNASVDIVPVMNAQDVQAGVERAVKNLR
jgi:hypothetical protein